jgi:enoyl-CoA hydratase
VPPIPAAKGAIEVDVGPGPSGAPTLAYVSCTGGCHVVVSGVDGKRSADGPRQPGSQASDDLGRSGRVGERQSEGDCPETHKRTCSGYSARVVAGIETMTYAVTGRVARITLNRPERGNGITRGLVSELERCVERADLDPAVHVILLAGNGKGFCGGYDLVESAERQGRSDGEELAQPPGSPLDPMVMAANHDPEGTWDSMVDYGMMGRNVRAFMSLFHCSKPVVCKVQGFCVAGGTDMALCSDLLVIAADAKIGYPPARVWGTPTTSMWAYRLGPQRAKRLLFTGDCLSGAEALEWGLAIEAPAAEDLDERAEILVERIARNPLNQLQMMKLLVNQSLYAQGLHQTQILGTVFDGLARHTKEGYAFQQRAAQAGFKQAVRERDEPFGDHGASTFKG